MRVRPAALKPVLTLLVVGAAAGCAHARRPEVAEPAPCAGVRYEIVPTSFVQRGSMGVYAGGGTRFIGYVSAGGGAVVDAQAVRPQLLDVRNGDSVSVARNAVVVRASCVAPAES